MTQAGGTFGLVELPGGWTVGRFAALEAMPKVVHLVTTRRGLDVDQVRLHPDAATRQAGQAIGLAPTAWVHQVHGPTCLVARRDELAGREAFCLGQADAIVTDQPLLGVSCRSADCPLVLAAGSNPDGRTAVGVAHASWRGTVACIAEVMVREMVDRFGLAPAGIVAGICPSAGPCCYEVQDDVFQAARESLGPSAERLFPRRDGRMFMDLWRANREQLRACGLNDGNIHTAGLCTLCRNDLFPSHRKEAQQAGRFLAVIGIVP
ncbi:MAG: Laccase domain protein [Planctomycetes bacterium ADurb.Bin126]|nr:MAG: Laccase domain protein [Planctomycetes bacterium ADurb.Bin126]HOD84758.1 polyphenol oxidase family protein [Phycisphaerae bacterium]HQL73041.1 polyphenol oxidase family protein [Phycisphaerae bacterium]